MSQDDNNIVTRNILYRVKVKYENAAAAVHFMVNSDSRYQMMDFFLQQDKAKKVFFHKKKRDSAPLTKKQVEKIHHFWGQIHPLKLEKIVRNSVAFDESTIEHIRSLKNCEACKLENRRPPKPKSTAQKSICYV